MACSYRVKSISDAILAHKHFWTATNGKGHNKERSDTSQMMTRHRDRDRDEICPSHSRLTSLASPPWVYQAILAALQENHLHLRWHGGLVQRLALSLMRRLKKSLEDEPTIGTGCRIVTRWAIGISRSQPPPAAQLRVQTGGDRRQCRCRSAGPRGETAIRWRSSRPQARGG